MLEKTRKRMIKRYAAQFMGVVKGDALGALDAATMPQISCEKRIPLKFTGYDEMFYVPQGRKGRKDRAELRRLAKAGLVRFGDGRCYNDGRSIEIFGCTYFSPEKIREAVRHEMLHAMLKQCGFPSDDDSEIFRSLAAIYCAGTNPKDEI